MTRTEPQKKDRHKGPKVRGVRVPDDLWEAVKERSSVEGRTINEGVVYALEAYVDRPHE